MSIADISFSCAWALVDGLVRGGVRHACVSPGSRSAPLALALARHPGITTHVHLDERSGAFFALGLAKALREPVAVACTSGTAAAELYPAVVEASQSRVPLILLTADRPPRLRSTGANQTIDQVELYGRFVRWFAEAPVPAGDADIEAWSTLGAEVLEAARTGHLPTHRPTHRPAGRRVPPPGPVQVDCPFDEPLVPVGTPPHGDPSTPEPFLEAFAPVGLRRPELADRLLAAERGLVVIGGLDRPRAELLELAEAVGVPVLAEPTSGLRRPGRALAAGQLLAASIGDRSDLAPDVVVQFGATPTSRATQRLVATAVHRIVVADDQHLDPDPEGLATERMEAPWEHSLPDLFGPDLPGPDLPGPDTGRLRWLRAADVAARAAIDALLDSWEEPSEMREARDLAASIIDGGTLFVGNSMPVRDLDTYMAPREGLRVLANRGASGIDGLVSTALGVAASNAGPTYALLGDLSFLHDAGALLWNARRGTDLVIVVNDNGGGQIFADLGQRELPADELERLFVTPHGADIATLCAAAGAGHRSVDRAADLVPAVAEASVDGGVQVVQVVIDADRDRARRVELQTAAAGALDRLDSG